MGRSARFCPRPAGVAILCPGSARAGFQRPRFGIGIRLSQGSTARPIAHAATKANAFTCRSNWPCTGVGARENSRKAVATETSSALFSNAKSIALPDLTPPENHRTPAASRGTRPPLCPRNAESLQRARVTASPCRHSHAAWTPSHTLPRGWPGTAPQRRSLPACPSARRGSVHRSWLSDPRSACRSSPWR